jgi:hypothetical protein
MQKIKIYGERHTGSNYLSRLIRLNLDVEELPGTAPKIIRKLESFLLAHQRLRDIYFSLTFQRNLGWKHTRVPPPDRLMQCALLARGEVAIVTLVKNPYSWLLSMYRSPYHARSPDKSSNGQTFEAFLHQPWSTLGRDNAPDIVDNPVQLWNLKNLALAALPESMALHLTTEETIVTPADAINKIAERFAISRREEGFIDFQDSTKNRPGQDGDYYRDYYAAERWREELSSQAIDWINAEVDTALMQRLGYQVL